MRITVTVNGSVHESDAEPRLLLVDWLRDDLGLTGTHIGCEDGKCGACTVVVNGQATKACLLFAVQVDGAEVETVESLATGTTLHPIQAAFHEAHALQCGFCTPGMLMTTKAILAGDGELSDTDVRRALAGNLCRCTGYTNIASAVLVAAERMHQVHAGTASGAIKGGNGT